ncbi:MAG: acetyl-CoA carboxylase biotin carboxyl carrier protein [Betaproteobacteria bacterium]|nr:acetyl-CoA carboxylase biotin carboxyl carrier protein [Betaproteobacteria bacterium]
MSLTHEDVQKILAIVEESDCDEVRLEFGDLKLHLRRRGTSSEISQEPRPQNRKDAQSRREFNREAAAPAAPVPVEELPEGVTAVTAPMLGSFYRSASPGEKPFVEQGDKVAPDDTVCLVEVMKLFNSVKAGVGGAVESILVENGALVEYGQPLILIRKEAS